MTEPSGVVSLLTDFGTRDPFVGVMKGVMLARAPGLRLVDLTHELEAQAVADAAFWLGHSFAWFPRGTVHLAVVDPGVGSARAAVVVRAQSHLFVGPDNGIFELVTRRAGVVEARAIAPERLGLAVPSRTFHGRDVFAPVAALLASGALGFDEVGPEHRLLETEGVPEPALGRDGSQGVVTVVDRFGNLITNLPGDAVASLAGSVFLGEERLELVRTFAEVAPGAPAAVVGSCGTIEIFVRNGSAAARFGAERGALVRVTGARA